jgi:ribonuclease BN (tRNA processing enzyme)
MSDGLRLTVIGSSPAYTRRSSPSSCYLVELDETAVVLDLGQGSFPGLARRREPASLSAVVVSHLHPDHHIDLVPLRHYLMYAPHPPGRVELHAPAGLQKRYDELNGEAGFLDALLERPPLEPGQRWIGPLTVTIGRVTHTESSFGFRIARTGLEAPGLVYSGDCGRPDDLLPLLLPGDTLLCEATWGSGTSVDEVEHMTGAQAGWAAREGGAARLLLTHILDEDARGTVPAARREYRGEVALARPGLVVTI